MRILLAVAGALVLVLVAWAAVVVSAANSGEVVRLTTFDSAGAAVQSQVWVVDYEGMEWVRAGDGGREWFERLRANPGVTLTRRGITSERCAMPMQNPRITDGVNQAFADKYGFANLLIAWSPDTSKRVPILLRKKRSAWHACPRVDASR